MGVMLQSNPAPRRPGAQTISEEHVAAIYYFFGREAELQDQHALAPAAAWQTMGKVICALVAANGIRRHRDVPSAVAQRLTRIRRKLNQLEDAARMGGTSSAGTARWLATSLSSDFRLLEGELRGLIAMTVGEARG